MVGKTLDAGNCVIKLSRRGTFSQAELQWKLRSHTRGLNSDELPGSDFTQVGRFAFTLTVKLS